MQGEIEQRLLKPGEVAARLGVSLRKIWAMRSAGKLPAPIQLGRATRWRAGDIDEFILAGCRVEATGARR